MFSKNSRYSKVKDHQMIHHNGRIVHYKGIRFIPNTAGRMIYEVKDGDRLDRMAFDFYKDSEQFWRICDANQAMVPDDLIRKPGVGLSVPPIE